MDKHAGTFVFGHSGPSVNYGEVENHEPTFDSLCDLAREVRQSRDGLTWKLGDLVNILLENQLGTIPEFAKHVGLTAHTLEGYGRVSDFYPDSQRLFAYCGYTHYKYARQFAAGDMNKALDFLEYAEGIQATCDEFYKYLCDMAGKPQTEPSKKELLAENSELRELLMEAAKWLDGYTPPGLLNRIEETLARLNA